MVAHFAVWYIINMIPMVLATIDVTLHPNLSYFRTYDAAYRNWLIICCWTAKLREVKSYQDRLTMIPQYKNMHRIMICYKKLFLQGNWTFASNFVCIYKTWRIHLVAIEQMEKCIDKKVSCCIWLYVDFIWINQMGRNLYHKLNYFNLVVL